MAKYCRMSDRRTNTHQTQSRRPMRLSLPKPVRSAMDRLAQRRGYKWGRRWNRSKLVAELVQSAAQKEGVWHE